MASSWKFKSQCDFNRLMNCRAKKGEAYVPTDVEHVANIITHGFWVIPSALATLWMVYRSNTYLQYKMALVYGLALTALFFVSCIFHSLSFIGRYRKLKNFFHIGDRAIIYIFIASSYTPWLVLKDLGGLGDETLVIVWTMAAVGILYQYVFHEKYKWLEIVFYLTVGVCPALVTFTMRDSTGLYELALGGMTYIAGVVFFKCDGIIPFAHAIWHCFVLVGAMLHYYAISAYLLGREKDEVMWGS